MPVEGQSSEGPTLDALDRYLYSRVEWWWRNPIVAY